MCLAVPLAPELHVGALRLESERYHTSLRAKHKNMEFRGWMVQVKLRLETCDRRRAERGEIALQVFELSQTLREKWLAPDYHPQRRLLEIVCLNFRFDGVSLLPTIRKPFDIIAEGLVPTEIRGD